MLLNIGGIYKTALVSLTFLIDIFDYFAPAWQNEIKYGGVRELKKPSLGTNRSLLRVRQSILKDREEYLGWKILQSWFTLRCFAPNSDNSSNMQKFWYKTGYVDNKEH